ncbi:peptidase C15 [Spirulina sp. CCNP1310]|uniref:pyroglutamyl-peptidase I family protein n=1 Tax=Spirulina sp. CCNP1310 TaxID=3110249 RepID=UPI002B203E70|nr:peptidase C15 [Spirulina sp. CCNP1310]MEA5419385.1 peptidase C15 [Spirulina sp. CCNP1310]
MSKLLLTSFAPWLAHHRSNAADDLLGLLPPDDRYHLLRQLPVDTALARRAVLATMAQVRPAGVVCCGMAEGRSLLTVEARAREGTACHWTALDLPKLITGLAMTGISEDAGLFVCEGLYYGVLEVLPQLDWPCFGLFVHVPLLTPLNRAIVLGDFRTILGRLI